MKELTVYEKDLISQVVELQCELYLLEDKVKNIQESTDEVVCNLFLAKNKLQKENRIMTIGFSIVMIISSIFITLLLK